MVLCPASSTRTLFCPGSVSCPAAAWRGVCHGLQAAVGRPGCLSLVFLVPLDTHPQKGWWLWGDSPHPVQSGGFLGALLSQLGTQSFVVAVSAAQFGPKLSPGAEALGASRADKSLSREQQNGALCCRGYRVSVSVCLQVYKTLKENKERFTSRVSTVTTRSQEDGSSPAGESAS